MLLLVILLSLLLVPDAGAGQMSTAVTAPVHPLRGFSYSVVITPEAIKEIPVKVDPVQELQNEVENYAERVSAAVENLRKLYGEAKAKNFVVPLRFIEGNIKAVDDLTRIFYKKLKEIQDKLEKAGKITPEIEEKVRVIRMLAERIEMLTLSSREFYKQTTNFVPFRVRILKD